MHVVRVLTGAVGLVLPGVAASCSDAPPFSPSPIPTSIPSSQPLNGSAFIGSGAFSNTLAPKWIYYPEASLMHGDAGNVGSIDHPGPLGWNLTITSGLETLSIMLWGPDGSLTTGYANTSAGVTPVPRGIAAVDPTTLQVLASWFPPDQDEILSLAYIEYLQATNDLVLSTQQGQIYIVHRDNCCGNPFFTLTRTINVADILTSGEMLLNSNLDTAGNVWFSTGGLVGAGDAVQNSTLVGYVKPDGAVYSKRIETQMVENGIAISNTTIFMVTGPSGPADTANATGYMWSLTAGTDGEIEVLWQEPYSAGSAFKPGGFARGSGATPALMNDQFVAITDNADTQIHLLVYHQSAQAGSMQQLACSVPLFEPGASANDLAVTVHFDGEKYGVIVLNDYDGPHIMLEYGAEFDVNGGWNDMSKMAPGIVRVDVSPDGQTCQVAWDIEMAMKAVPVLSITTGLLYGYLQDTVLSAEGEYIWYLVAIDWVSGAVVWQQRMGAGGTYNDNWAGGTVGPDGTFYQSVIGGVVMARDGA
ncbi:hypothetical protein GQ53DRAFT_795976 [Thozetella sp. PMI_491]|nr:hypothetical protein GQ53DRAFT_795976 [Thozetella sp. PMI_491]